MFVLRSIFDVVCHRHSPDNSTTLRLLEADPLRAPLPFSSSVTSVLVKEYHSKQQLFISGSEHDDSFAIIHATNTHLWICTK
eukprot:scaffold7553_cov169-Skeletonema_marinoi.AAC.1